MEEIDQKFIKEEDKKKRMRWFTSTVCDLFVWTDKRGRIIRFQFCYHKGTEQENMIEWRQRWGVRHNYIDDGEGIPQQKASPIVIPDGIWSQEEVLSIFEKESQGIDQKIADYVKATLSKKSL